MSGQVLDYDSIAADYARHRRVHPGILASLVATSGITSGSRVLEVGCGTGNYVLALEALAGVWCEGVDPSEGMLAQARSRSGRVRFRRGQAECLDYPQASFDLVFSVDVVHHIQDCPKYFQEAYRVLKVGGRVCTATDSEWIIRHRQPLADYFPETVAVELDRYPRIAELRDTMEKVGFGELIEGMVEFPYQVTEVQAYRDRSFSVLHLISDGAFQRGLERLERDLRRGPIQCVSRYTLLWGTR